MSAPFLEQFAYLQVLKFTAAIGVFHMALWLVLNEVYFP